VAPGIIIQITGDGAGAAEALRIIEQRMQQTRAAGTSMANDLEAAGARIQSALQFAGIAFSAQALMHAFTGTIKSATDFGVEIGKLHQQTGISTESLSVLKYAASQTGVEFETLTKGFKKLALQVYEADGGSQKAIKSFADLGITQRQLADQGNDMYGVMALVADKFKELPAGIEKSAIASEIFGARMGSQMIPVLNLGSEGIIRMRNEAESLGIVLDEAGIAKLEELHRSVDQMQTSLEGLALTFTSALAPAIGEAAKQLTQFINAMRTGHAFEMGLANALINAGFKDTGQKLYDDALSHTADDTPKGSYGENKGKISQLGGGDPEAAKKALADANRAEEASGEAMRLIDEEARKELTLLEETNAAKLRLAEAQGKASEDVIKSHGALQLAILEGQHADGLTTDRQFYTQKLQIEEAAFAAEHANLQKQRDDLASQPRSEADGNRRFEIDAKLVELDAKLSELADRRAIAEAQITSELQKQQGYHKTEMDSAVRGVLDRGAEQQKREAKEVANTVTGMVEQISSAAMSGRDSFKQMADDMIRDVERLALKLAEEKWLIPFIQQLFGGTSGSGVAGIDTLTNADTSTSMIAEGVISGLPGFASGGDPTGPSIVGENGPELFTPKGPGTITPNSALQKLSEQGSGGGQPNVTINMSNNTSSPATMRQTGMSYDSEARQFIVHTVLENMSQGGELSQAGLGGQN
jgi:hypothetical protein